MEESNPLDRNRREGRVLEPAINKGLARIAKQHGLVDDLAQLVLTTAAQGGGKASELAEQMRLRLPRDGLDLKAEQRWPYRWSLAEWAVEMTYEKDSRKARNQFIDWSSFTEKIAIAVEIKIKDVPAFQFDQLRRYRRALQRNSDLRRRPYKGIVVLSRVVPAPSDLDLPHTEDVLLGVVLWKHVLPGLRTMVSVDRRSRRRG